MGKTKTADFLADCFEHYADTHRPYIYGTYGMILTLDRLEWCARNYPKYLSPARVEYAKKHYLGKRTDDCVGGEKNVAWLPGTDPDANPIYDPDTDWSADTTFSKATVKGPIKTIPKRRGICVRYPGHTGVLVDPVNMIVVEFRGFDYGCVRTKLKERKWTDWFEHPLFDYTQEDKCMVQLPILRKGMKDTNGSVTSWQGLLQLYGYTDGDGNAIKVDGSFGTKTEQATKKVQKKHGLPQTGVVDAATWRAIIV